MPSPKSSPDGWTSFRYLPNVICKREEYDTPIDTRAKEYEHMLKKGGLKMNAENALKLLGKYVVVTNPKGQIMDVLGIEYIKFELRY